MVFVTASDPSSVTAVKTGLDQIADQYHSLTVQTGAAFADTSSSSVRAATIAAYALALVGFILFVLVVIAVLGQTVADRRTDYATVRALGASAGQIRTTVVIESILISFIGCLIGLVLGVVFAYVLRSAFSFSTLAIPWLWLVGCLIVSIIVGALAPLGVARRATQAVALD
jgi:putative ABC transport system permease protein